MGDKPNGVMKVKTFKMGYSLKKVAPSTDPISH
jgi:hypothetical protein